MTREISGSITRTLVAGLLLLALAGCRQADGTPPVPIDEQPNKIADVGRDLQNVAGGAAGAGTDLADDLLGLDVSPPPAALTQELIAALEQALAGKTLGDAEAQRIANALFVASTGRELSGRQITKLGEDMQAALAATGASAEAAQRAAAAVTAVAAAVTRNEKRWYHIGS